MSSTATLRAPLQLLRLEDTGRAQPFVGSSTSVVQLLERVDRLAATDLPILITGESGTGKELLAHRVHEGSIRAAGPFVAENCAAIPDALLESEFFGHVRGAFTGAEGSNDGALVRADGGTLLLDEIGDMPLALQAKLLRVLEDGRVRPVGGSAARVVDVRLVSATNHDLATCVREGKFREDLLYRIGAASVDIPPLRARSTDVAELALHFLEELNRRFGTSKRFSTRTLSGLVEQRWPGNARELRNKVALLYYLSENDDLRDETGALDGSSTRARAGLVTAVAPLIEIEREAIMLALEETCGDRAEAARRLGISRAKVYDRVRRFGL